MRGRGAVFGVAVLVTLGVFVSARAPEARTEAAKPLPDVRPVLAALEKRSGGRLGVALMDENGELLAGMRADERFAMCSTFKLPLAVVMLNGVDDGRWPMDKALPLAAPLPDHSPVSETYLSAGAMSARSAAEAAVTQSDNGAANALLVLIGGPAGMTAALREWGDDVTRLDRSEPALNENSRGDPRDTTTPAAMADLVRLSATGRLLHSETRALLRNWLLASKTGKARIRAGLPAKWQVGDKTGTCGTAYNDVAFIRVGKQEYQLAIYLDRPTVTDAAAEAILADAAKAVVPVIEAR